MILIVSAILLFFQIFFLRKNKKEIIELTENENINEVYDYWGSVEEEISIIISKINPSLQSDTLDKITRSIIRFSQKYYLNPYLITAIIYCESHFIPNIEGKVGDAGLMQIIPRYAGCDAYKYIYDKEKILDSAYLYKPENNIELGAAYLHLLKRKHFSSIPKNPKNRYLTVCGYNWGPGAMRNKILKRYNIDNMSDADLFGLLRKKTPKETSDYLKRVTERMPLYSSFFN